MKQPDGTQLQVEAAINAGPRGPLTFCGFKGDPGFEDLQHGSAYKTRMRERLYQQLCKDSDFVEVGAHIGETTLHAAQHFQSVIAFEPSPTNRECLGFNIERNQYFRNVHVRPEAVSDHEGTTQFYLYANTNAVGHSLTEAIVYPGAPHIDVVVGTLDSIHPTGKCTMLHIDAEGHDIRVLHGGRKFIGRQARKPVICIEYAPQMLLRSGSNAQQLVEWLSEMGYNAYTDAGNNWAPIPYATIVALYDAWARTCCGWIDLYLLPIGERLGGMFPESRI
jgi:FkbM family methyltransferase